MAHTPLHLSRFGHGPRTFFGLHGWGSTGSQSFQDIARFLPQDHATLLAPDLPGCGQSSPPSSWDFDLIHQHLLHEFDALTSSSSEPVTLIGSCSGSFHALPIAIDRPSRIREIILLEPFAFMPWFFSIFLTPLTGYPLYKVVFDNPIGKAITRSSLRRQGGDQEKVDMVGNFGKQTDLEAAYQYLRHYGQITDHTVFAQASAPVRIICGENSFKAIHKSVSMWQENWPALTLHQLPGIGHMLSQEAPDLTASLIFSLDRA